MRSYIRLFQPGGCYFFTVVTGKRAPHFSDDVTVERLKQAFRHVIIKHPFTIDAIVVMPDHLHAVWSLPDGDSDFSTRWRLIKHFVSRGADGNAPFWQPRFWEHLIRDEADYQQHIDYIHYNPVKHGFVTRPEEWHHSSYHKAMELGLYPAGWGHIEPNSCRELELE